MRFLLLKFHNCKFCNNRMKVEKAKKSIMCRGKRRLNNKRSEWGKGKDSPYPTMGHMVNKSDVRDTGEALQP